MSECNCNGRSLNQKVQIHENGSKEYWRDVVGYRGFYRVSDWGRVKSVPRRTLQKDGKIYNRRGRILKAYWAGRLKYMMLCLCRDDRRDKKYIHQIVLEAFIGPCPEGMQCRHLDGNNRNNNLTNLCWGTAQENSDDRIRHGTVRSMGQKGEKNPKAKLTEDEVRTIRRLYATGDFSQESLGKRFKVGQDQVSSIVRRETWKHVD